jgi:hypothetical protein
MVDYHAIAKLSDAALHVARMYASGAENDKRHELNSAALLATHACF